MVQTTDRAMLNGVLFDSLDDYGIPAVVAATVAGMGIFDGVSPKSRMGRENGKCQR